MATMLKALYLRAHKQEDYHEDHPALFELISYDIAATVISDGLAEEERHVSLAWPARPHAHEGAINEYETAHLTSNLAGTGLRFSVAVVSDDLNKHRDITLLNGRSRDAIADKSATYCDKGSRLRQKRDYRLSYRDKCETRSTSLLCPP